MTTYNIELVESDLLKIGFGAPADNNQIVQDVHARLEAMRESGELKGGQLLRITGPASLPVAVTLAHGVQHLYGAIAVFDPKLNKYVVSISHNPNYRIGDLID